MKSFLLNAGEGCRVWFCELSDIGEFVKGGKVAIVTNKHVRELYEKNLTDALDAAQIGYEIFELPVGEDAKTLDSLHTLYDWLLDHNFERSDYLVSFGGGSVGDIAGFAAATFKRGMNFAYIPTTLLSQSDSSIGGKYAINYKVKNMIGLIYQPKFVLIDTKMLGSLSENEISLGLVEIVKHAVIDDEELFTHIEENVDSVKKLEGIDKIVWKSCKIKASIVDKDERDHGARMLLNYGHTIGQAIEAASGYTVSHGEAVSIGMCYEAQLAHNMDLIDQESVDRQKTLLERLGMKTEIDSQTLKEALKYLKNDKKAKGGELRFALPASIGRVVIKTVPLNQAQDFLAKFIDEHD